MTDDDDVGTVPSVPLQPSGEEALLTEEPPAIPIPLEEFTEAGVAPGDVQELEAPVPLVDGLDGAGVHELDTDILDEADLETS